MTDATDALLAEREQTHGSYVLTASYSQHLKKSMRDAHGWKALPAAQREALDMIMTKVARILSGNGEFPDHWDDIAGYARLASRTIIKMKDQK